MSLDENSAAAAPQPGQNNDINRPLKLQKDPTFYPSTIIYQVDNTLFKFIKPKRYSRNGAEDTSSSAKQNASARKNPILLDSGITVDDFRVFLRLLNYWVESDCKPSWCDWPIGPNDRNSSQMDGDSLFVALNVARMEPELQQYEEHVLEAIEDHFGYTTRELDFRFLELGCTHRIEKWVINGCSRFLLSPNRWSFQQLSQMLSSETIAKLFYIRDQINSAVATAIDAPTCESCRTPATREAIPAFSVLSRVCDCRQISCIVGHDPRTYSKGLVEELVEQLFFLSSSGDTLNAVPALLPTLPPPIPLPPLPPLACKSSPSQKPQKRRSDASSDPPAGTSSSKRRKT